ncbi:hypothetical protein [Maridesulfovibrio salexigens]|uniref:hypothetical protein n=1 Tax=Maridesulfovibrio salexigens TaxID=880 RepID=UPI0012ED4C5F|nr:hypothetical protein [Maridesulfovibrio salexigens]
MRQEENEINFQLEGEGDLWSSGLTILYGEMMMNGLIVSDKVRLIQSGDSV